MRRSKVLFSVNLCNTKNPQEGMATAEGLQHLISKNIPNQEVEDSLIAGRYKHPQFFASKHHPESPNPPCRVTCSSVITLPESHATYNQPRAYDSGSLSLEQLRSSSLEPRSSATPNAVAIPPDGLLVSTSRRALITTPKIPNMPYHLRLRGLPHDDGRNGRTPAAEECSIVDNRLSLPLSPALSTSSLYGGHALQLAETEGRLKELEAEQAWEPASEDLREETTGVEVIFRGGHSESCSNEADAESVPEACPICGSTSYYHSLADGIKRTWKDDFMEAHQRLVSDEAHRAAMLKKYLEACSAVDASRRRFTRLQSLHLGWAT